MLATMAHTTQDLPSRERSHLDIHPNNPSAQAPNLALEDRLCPGCKKSAVNEAGGLVVAFGQSFFHVDCFKCAKCGDKVTADTNLLLLSDGSPICANCSYSCNVCHQPILDEAIMTGDDSYHAHCFKCKVCKNRIDELVFAKTSHGIYCMNCHNERMIRMRKHTQKKAERERAGGSGSSKSREREARNFHKENGRASPADSQSRPGSSKSHNLQMSGLRPENGRPGSSRGLDTIPQSSPVKEQMPLSSEVRDMQNSETSTGSPQTRLQDTSSHVSPGSALQSIAVNIAPPENEQLPPSYFADDINRPNPVKQATLPVPFASTDSERDGRRRSYDDGVRPLDVLLKQRSLNTSSGLSADSAVLSEPSTSLSVSTSRRDKRRSINPGMVLPSFNDASQSSSNLSPGLDSQITAQPSPPYPGHESSSPLQEHFQTSSRPNSHSSSIHSYHSFASPPYTDDQWNDKNNMTRSRSASASTTNEPQDDQTIVVRPPPSVTLEPVPPRAHNSAHRNGVRPLPIPGASQVSNRTPLTLNSADNSGLHSPRSVGDFSRPSAHRLSSSSSSKERYHAGGNSRSASPSYRADVPHSIESGTDTEPEPEPELEPESLDSPHSEHDVSFTSQANSSSEDLAEVPVERTSHATFIAPALPPIRFSLSSAGFADLLSSVGGLQSAKYADTLEKLKEDSTTNGGSALPHSEIAVFSERVETPPATNTKHAVVRHSNEHSAATGVLNEMRLGSSRSTLSIGPHTQSHESSVSSGNLGGVGTNPANVAKITITEPESSFMKREEPGIASELRKFLEDARMKGLTIVSINRGFMETILDEMESRMSESVELKAKVDGMKRTSKQYMDGLTVAQTEYDRELKARRDAEAEVTRLRVLLSGQAARLTALSGDSKRQEVRQQLSKELNDNLSGLEQDLSRLKAERDVTLAEVEELSVTKSSPEPVSANLGRSLTKRLDSIKAQYQRDLIPLTQQREALNREIAELKAVRDVFLEETTVLNARNEELAQLSAVYARRLENLVESPGKIGDTLRPSLEKQRSHSQLSQSQPATSLAPSLNPSTSTSSTIYEDTESRFPKGFRGETEMHTPAKKPLIKWPTSKAKDAISPASSMDTSKAKAARLEHNFQQLSVLRFTRCDHCGDKMWGSQLRCTICNTSIHVRCITHVQTPCAHQITPMREELPSVPLPPSMFGRDLTEQVRADAKGDGRQVPVIVEKCIAAVEALALDYEGIYRKTGGSGQSKAITQLFERGDYAAFDLLDSDRFNDICSVTSVLKTYFRSLPNPLLTFEFHDRFMAAIAIRDLSMKHKSLFELIHQLPSEHYNTLRLLMLHLHNVRQRCEKNLMNARNLGVVFGPTLMRSRDPGAEFSDMAGKALFVEWLVENAPDVFSQNRLS
ncbi:hypothetical protein BDQ17DRAFT_125529 [Cyathus striatus]|nr:hypothetical protein BDQ17DRAFT_125529 [Cyathus striatus]